ncbi:MAG TPA: hypothetical protein PLK12_15155 [Prolixibacteraceae bacterium]|nr:hypothetical protein [Prolixibacteraceae bacterium]
MRRSLPIGPLFSAILFVVSFSSCNDDPVDYIPYRYVNVTVDLNINTNLASSGYSEYYAEAGYGGLIIYCEFYDYSAPDNSLFHAWDAACPFEASRECIVENDGNSFHGTCPCCGSKFQFSSGFPTDDDAPATYPLKEYSVTIMNNKLYISN